jgi:hypothetical protein
MFVCTALLASTSGFVMLGQDAGILGAITEPERAIASDTGTLTGTWLIELKRPGAPAGQLGPLIFVVFQPNGTVTGAAADGSQSSHSGVWVRTGDRKFLQTMYLFAFNESRALATIQKVRINVRLSADGQKMQGTTEAVIMDREGKVQGTFGGTTYSGVRLSAEKPGDFEAFQQE